MFEYNDISFNANSSSGYWQLQFYSISINSTLVVNKLTLFYDVYGKAPKTPAIIGKEKDHVCHIKK
jgi:hypothetical protein